jgi:menaquinone-9 beta-reductase
LQADVLVIGGGPAGIATAIAASQKGLQVTVVDSRRPPIDKPCGEGLLPDAMAALHRLGIDLGTSSRFAFSGLCFSDEKTSASARIETGEAFGIRRTVFHQILVDRALALGVNLLWATRLVDLHPSGAETTRGLLSARWLVGADGSRSTLRRLVGLEPRRRSHARIGFRRHYEIAPWTDHVEVHWGENCQLVVTPTGCREVCLTLFTSDSRLRLDRALDGFPRVARRVAESRPTSTEAGAVTLLQRARAVTRGHVALVGDASCTVDGIAGQGLSLAFGQAMCLAEALAQGGDLAPYEAAHRRLAQRPVLTTRLLLAMGAHSALRRKVLRLFAARPALFAKMISIHTGQRSPDALDVGELLSLGWRVIWA